MFAHHRETIDRAVAHFRSDPEVSAILLTGSITHGFATEGSDVDVAVVVSDAEHARRASARQLTFASPTLATYEGGYVDAKYISPAFLEAVERRGSEPARFSFAHARILWGESAELTERLARISAYPRADKDARIARFRAQLEAWHWYTSQAALRHDDYLMNLALSKLILFGGRMVLAHNELLYPYHKWFLRVLERAPDTPPRFVDAIRALSRERSAPRATEFYELVRDFRQWPVDATPWPDRFLVDSELTWLDREPPIDDL